MAGRKRKIPLYFMVSEKEHALIKGKMAKIGTRNLGAYLRKMAIDGLIINLDIADLSEMVRLLRISSNNINQYAKRLNQTGRAYKTDVEDLQARVELIWELANHIINRLATIK